MIFDANSGGGQITVVLASMSFTSWLTSGFTGTFTWSSGSGTLTWSDTIQWGANMWTNPGTLLPNITESGTGTKNLDLNNVTLGTWTKAVAGSTILVSDLTCGSFVHSAGVFLNTNNRHLTVNNAGYTMSGSAQANFGSGILECSGNTGILNFASGIVANILSSNATFLFTGVTGVSFQGCTQTLRLTSETGVTFSIAKMQVNSGQVFIQNGGGSSKTLAITELNIGPTADLLSFPSGITYTIGTLSGGGNGTIFPILRCYEDVSTAVPSIDVTTATIDNIFVSQVNATGAATPIAVTGGGAGSPSGWSFTAPVAANQKAHAELWL
jgi:hypothetical protein